MPLNITPGPNWEMEEVKQLADTIRKTVLPAMQKASGQEEILVTCRLNETSIASPAPVWAAWVESKALQKQSSRQGTPPMA